MHDIVIECIGLQNHEKMDSWGIIETDNEKVLRVWYYTGKLYFDRRAFR